MNAVSVCVSVFGCMCTKIPGTFGEVCVKVCVLICLTELVCVTESGSVFASLCVLV